MPEERRTDESPPNEEEDKVQPEKNVQPEEKVQPQERVKLEEKVQPERPMTQLVVTRDIDMNPEPEVRVESNLDQADPIELK